MEKRFVIFTTTVLWKGNKRKKKRVNRFEGSSPLPSIKGRSISNVDPSLNVVSAGSGTYDHLAILSQDLELLHSTITRSRRADKASSHLYADIARPQFLRASRSRFPRIKFWPPPRLRHNFLPNRYLSTILRTISSTTKVDSFFLSDKLIKRMLIDNFCEDIARKFDRNGSENKTFARSIRMILRYDKSVNLFRKLFPLFLLALQLFIVRETAKQVIP